MLNRRGRLSIEGCWRLFTPACEQVSQVLALSLAERRAFTRWVDEHRDEIEQPSVLVRAQESEILQRLAEMEADPGSPVTDADADAEQMFKEIMDERAAKASSRSR